MPRPEVLGPLDVERIKVMVATKKYTRAELAGIFGVSYSYICLLINGNIPKRHPAYGSWINMRQRCENPNHTGYKYYGGRGITVCERWKNFKTFLADMGEKPKGYTIDRINNDGNYEPSNCRWATYKEQIHNQRRGPRGPRKPKNTFIPCQETPSGINI